jgi:hypothetical protein
MTGMMLLCRSRIPLVDSRTPARVCSKWTCSRLSSRRRSLANSDLEERRRASAIRRSNAFHAKSNAFRERYAALPHVTGRSYIVAISNCGTQDSYLQGDAPMQCLLFDIDKQKTLHKDNGAPVPLDYFVRTPTHISVPSCIPRLRPSERRECSGTTRATSLSARFEKERARNRFTSRVASSLPGHANP